MQRKELEDIIKKLEEINSDLKNKAIEKAIENLKIALHGDIFGSESFKHNYIRKKMMEIIPGNVYMEGVNTGFSKIGFRPDIIIINEKEFVIIEIETTKKRAKNKMDKIWKNIEKIKENSLTINRKIRIIFCLTFFDDELIDLAKKYNFEVFVLKEYNLLRVV